MLRVSQHHGTEDTLGLGLTIIASVALLPRGLVGVPGQIRERLMGRASRRAETAEAQDELA